MNPLIQHPYVTELKHAQTKAEIRFFHILQRVIKEFYPDYRDSVQKQVPIRHSKGFFIIDFYIGALQIGFEIDGGYHWQSHQLDQDLRRDEILHKEKHIKLYHFGNDTVLGRPKEIRERLVYAIDKRIRTRNWITERKACTRGPCLVGSL